MGSLLAGACCRGIFVGGGLCWRGETARNGSARGRLGRYTSVVTLLDPSLRQAAAGAAAAELRAIVEREAGAREAFRRWLPDGAKAEFINGERVTHVAVRRVHSGAVRRALCLIDAYRAARSLGHVGFEKDLVALTRNDYEPDVCWWGPEKAATFTDNTVYYPAPDLVVEVLSPSTEATDRGIKFEDYAAHDVAEHWILDPDAQTVEQYLLRDGAFQLHMKASQGTLASSAIGGMEIPVEALFSDAAQAAAVQRILQK